MGMGQSLFTHSHCSLTVKWDTSQAQPQRCAQFHFKTLQHQRITYRGQVTVGKRCTNVDAPIEIIEKSILFSIL
jgi:flagella basal body P-ring formation protein FlgA